MNDTAFTAPAGWGWLIIGYFFLGGLSAGSYVLGALIDLFGKPEHRPAGRMAYLASLPALLLCPPLLIIDLDRPLRFYHLFYVPKHSSISFKWYSPMSIGAWALLVFSAFSFLSFLGALAEQRGGQGPYRRLMVLRQGLVHKALAGVGAAVAFFVAGYTGVLLTVTNRPLWSETPLLGGLFVASATAASAALVGWLAERRAKGAEGLGWLSRMERVAVCLEIALVTALLAWTGAGAWRGEARALLAAALVFGGVVPLSAWLWRPRSAAHGPVALSALAGSLALRAAVVLAAEGLGRA